MGTLVSVARGQKQQPDAAEQRAPFGAGEEVVSVRPEPTLQRDGRNDAAAAAVLARGPGSPLAATRRVPLATRRFDGEAELSIAREVKTIWEESTETSRCEALVFGSCSSGNRGVTHTGTSQRCQNYSDKLMVWYCLQKAPVSNRLHSHCRI